LRVIINSNCVLAGNKAAKQGMKTGAMLSGSMVGVTCSPLHVTGKKMPDSMVCMLAGLMFQRQQGVQVTPTATAGFSSPITGLAEWAADHGLILQIKEYFG